MPSLQQDFVVTVKILNKDAFLYSFIKQMKLCIPCSPILVLLRVRGNKIGSSNIWFLPAPKKKHFCHRLKEEFERKQRGS